MKKKVIVVGGGIAGLSAGIYAKRCGFDALVIESHSIAGGNCTSWRRGGYLFEGGMHWLTGSGDVESINRCWRTVGALGDDVKVHYPEPFSEIIHKGTPVRFYRNIDETQRHWLELSPDDAPAIIEFCGNIRKVQELKMPLSDVRGVKVTKKRRPSLSLVFTGISAMTMLSKMTRVNRNAFVSHFKHPGIRELLNSSTSDFGGILPLFFTLGTLARGDGGFPEGGSLPFVERIVKKFKADGGEILLNTKVERVVLENQRFSGVQVSGGQASGGQVSGDQDSGDQGTGTFLSADYVIVASDTMHAQKLFDAPLTSPWLEKMRSITRPTMCMLVSIGLNADLSAHSRGMVIKPPDAIYAAGQKYEYLSVNNYAADRAFSPEGKSAVTLILGGDSYDFWKNAKDEGRYEEEKEGVATAIVEALYTCLPETRGKAEVVDVATPLTYERYCDNWRGSWMSDVVSGEQVMSSYPAVIDGMNGVYFAGQRMMPPGGLPVALMSARAAVQYLCKDAGVVFVSED